MKRGIPLSPEERPLLLATPYGVLMHELMYSPGAVIGPLLSLLTGALDFCFGSYRSAFTELMLFLVRLASRVEAFALYAQSEAESHELEKSSATMMSPARAEALQQQLNNLHMVLSDQISEKIYQWLMEAQAANDEGGCAMLHAHRCMLSANATVAADRNWEVFLASSAHVVAWHRSADVDCPTGEVFAAINHCRADACEWAAQAPVAELGVALAQTAQTALENTAQETQGLADLTVGWKKVEWKAPRCTMLVETPHPYIANNLGDDYCAIRFPNAPEMELTFDDRCGTIQGIDYVTVHKDSSQQDTWGRTKRISGMQCWPGSTVRERDGSRQLAPLVIPSDHCYLQFHHSGLAGGEDTEPDESVDIVIVPSPLNIFAIAIQH
jgi:hypothetical protein